jgi:hypothetical protein
MPLPKWMRDPSTWGGSILVNLTANLIWSVVVAGLIAIAIVIWELLTSMYGPFIAVSGILAFAGVLWIVRTLTWQAPRTSEAPKAANVATASRNNAADKESIDTGRPWATQDELSQGHIHDRTFYLFDVPRDDEFNHEIKHRTIERCTILGPAIVYLDASIATETMFSHEGDIEGILWPKTNGPVVGSIRLKGCTLKNCRTRWVGFAGDETAINKFRCQVGGSPPTPDQPPQPSLPPPDKSASSQQSSPQREKSDRRRSNRGG